MSAPDVREALADDAAFIDAVLEGDPVGAARAAAAWQALAAPVSDAAHPSSMPPGFDWNPPTPDDAPVRDVLLYALRCAKAWEPAARILGNLRACDLSRALMVALAVHVPSARFPIMDGPSIPWWVIAPHDAQAQRNHGGQTLERLACRGGLSPTEALAVLEDRTFPRTFDAKADHDRLAAMVERWDALVSPPAACPECGADDPCPHRTTSAAPAPRR